MVWNWYIGKQNIDAAIDAIRSGKEPGRIEEFTFNDFADAPVKRLPHSPEEEREWRKTGAAYRHNRRRSEPYNKSNPEYGEDDYTRMLDSLDNAESIDRERFMQYYPDYGEADEHETNGDRIKKFGSADRFKPRWSVSEKTLRNLSREDTDTITRRAVEELGTTGIWEGAGYLMPDGRLLDFSESNNGGIEGERAMDHRQIGRFYDYIMNQPE